MVVTAAAFGIYVKGRAVAVAKATRDIRNLDLLSLETDITVFDLKIIPASTYGTKFFWNHIARSDLYANNSRMGQHYVRTYNLQHGSR